MTQLLDYISTHGINIGIIVFFITTFVEIAPIKVNPWSWLLGNIGNMLMGDMYKEMKDIKDRIDKMENEENQRRIKTLRWSILNFAHSLVNGQTYGNDVYNHVYEEHREYEELLRKNNMTNGQTTAAMRIIDNHYSKTQGGV